MFGPTNLVTFTKLDLPFFMASEVSFQAVYEIAPRRSYRSAKLVGAIMFAVSGVAEADGDALACIESPLFHISFLPDLMQVNFRFPSFFVELTFAHVVPAMVAECAGSEAATKIAVMATARNVVRVRNMRARIS